MSFAGWFTGGVGPTADPEDFDDEPDRPEAYRLTELAALTGVSERSIRYYQAEGLLPPPRKQGREAIYCDEHRERLALVGELQDRGFTLKTIRHLLERRSTAQSATEWLGIHDLLSESWSEEQPVLLSRRELDRRLGEHPPGTLAALERAGFLVRQPAGDVWLAPSLTLVELALRLDAVGVDLELSGETVALLRKALERAAADIAKLFLGRPGAGALGDIDQARLAEVLAVLRPSARQAVAVLFTDALEHALRQRLRDREA